MADLEEVIRGLELCGYQDGMPQCDSCPYDGKDCWTRLKRDAIALLKAHEARLLTLDEAKALPYDTDIWIEYLNIFNEPVTYAATICHNNKSYLAHRPADVLYHWYDYEKGFVIWLGRPTEEQQKAVKWDG